MSALIPRLTLTVLLLGLGTSCQTRTSAPKVVEMGPTGEAPSPSAPRKRVLGTVETVYPSQGFVLVRRSIDLIPVEGSRLIAQGDGPPSQLVTSSHRQGTFFSAMIEDGIPRPGETVRMLVRADTEEVSESLTLPDRSEWAQRAARASRPVSAPTSEPPATVPNGPAVAGTPVPGFVSMADDGGRPTVETDLEGGDALEDLASIARGPLLPVPAGGLIGTEEPAPVNQGPGRPTLDPLPPVSPSGPRPAPNGLPALQPPPGANLPPLRPPPGSSLPPLQPPPPVSR